MALSVFEAAFAKERTRRDANLGRRRFDYGRGQFVQSGRPTHEAYIESAARVLDAVQTVVDTLIPAGAKGKYTVAFGGDTAQTRTDLRRIQITGKPLRTKGLRLADVADILTGFVVHEIGHVDISDDTRDQIREWLLAEPEAGRWINTIKALGNVIDDHALEVRAKRRYPGVAHTFRVTTKYVAQDTGLPNKPPTKFDPSGRYVDRFNFMVRSVRYRWFARWSADARTRRERQYWIDWADTYGDPDDAAKRLEGIKVALARIATKPEDEDITEQGADQSTEVDESEDEPETFDTDESDEDDEDEDDLDGEDDDEYDDDEYDEDEDDDEGEGDESTLDSEDPDSEDEGEGEPEDDEDTAEGEAEDDESEDGDEDGEGNESDEPTDEEGEEDGEPSDDEGEDWGEHSVDDPGDEPDDYDGSEDDADGDESEGTDESGQDGLEQGSMSEGDDDEGDLVDDDDADERAEDTLDAGEDDLGEDHSDQTGGEPPVYTDFEDEELPSRDKDQTLDDWNDKRQTWEDEKLQNEVEVEMKATKVTDTHGYGTLKVVIDLQ